MWIKIETRKTILFVFSLNQTSPTVSHNSFKPAHKSHAFCSRKSWNETEAKLDFSPLYCSLKLVSLPLLCIPHSIQMSVNMFNLKNNFEKWKSNYSFMKKCLQRKDSCKCEAKYNKCVFSFAIWLKYFNFKLSFKLDCHCSSRCCMSGLLWKCKSCTVKGGAQDTAHCQPLILMDSWLLEVWSESAMR